MLKRAIASLLAVAFMSVAAWAVQPGTTGTNKANQTMGLRVGVFECLNRTATASAGAATINGVSNTQPSGCGMVTSESLTTAAGATYTLTLTNNLIAATDMVNATVQLGTSTTGMPTVASVTPGAGSVVIIVQNIHASAAFNGTIKIGFQVTKMSASDTD